MELLTLQILLSLCLSIMTMAVGLLPVTLLRALTRNAQQSKKISWALTLMSCFAGGVILATCFLDILPHVHHNYAKYRHRYNLKVAFPVPEFFVCVGFFLVYFIEELIIRVFGSNSGHGHSHSLPKLKDEEAWERLTDKDLKRTPSNGNSNENKENRKMPGNVHEMIVDECAKSISSDNHVNTGLLASIIFTAAMSFHSVLEGFALGVQEDATGAVTLFFSLLVDNAIDAFTVGLQVSRSNSNKLYLLIATVIIYGLMSPVGAIAGMALQNSTIDPQWRDMAIILLEGIAGGVFIFMTCLEILAHERANDHSNLVQLLAIIIGFGFIASLQINEYFHGEGDVHGH